MIISVINIAFILIALLGKMHFYPEPWHSFFTALYIFVIPIYYVINYAFIRKKSFNFSLLILLLLSEFTIFGLLSSLPSSQNHILILNNVIFYLFLISSILVFIITFIREFTLGTHTLLKNFFISTQLKQIFAPILTILVITSFNYFYIYRSNTPIGHITNWDFLHHIHLIKMLMAGKFNLLLTSISDTFTFNSYTPLFHVLITTPILLFKADPIKVVWWAEFFHYIFISLVSFWMGKKILNNNLFGIICALLSIMVFESQTSYTNLFFLPQTISATLGVVVLLNYLSKNNHNNSIFDLVLGAIMIFMLHYIVGTVFILICFIVLIYQKTTSNHFKNILLALSICIFSSALLLNFFNQIIVVTNREDAKYFIYSLPTLLSFFEQWYGFFPVLLIPIGLFLLFKNKLKFQNTNIVLILFFILIGLSLLPMSYALKFFTLTRYFVQILIAIGIYGLVHTFHSNIIKIIIFVVIFISFEFVFIVNVQSNIQLSYNGRYNSYISETDIDTANWINKSYASKRVFLISDPETQAVMEALSNVNTQGGAFPIIKTIDTLNNIYRTSQPNIMYAKLQSIIDHIPSENQRDITLFILSGRYFDWQKFSWDCKISYACQSWLPKKLDNSQVMVIRKLSDNNYFNLDYINDEDAVIRLNDQLH